MKISKKNNPSYKKNEQQIDNLTQCFANIKNEQIRQDILAFVKTLSDQSKTSNIKYIKEFSTCILNIKSIALKDKIIDIVRMIAY